MESKKVEFFNKLSFMMLLATLFLSLFFFIPYVPVTLEASKGFLLSVGVMLSLFFWMIARLGEGKFKFPKDRLLLFGAAIPLVFFVASLFSSSLYVSLFGAGFEIGTFGSMLIMYVIFFLSATYFEVERRVWYFFGALFLGAIILSVFELLNIFIGFGRFLPGLLQGISSGNLVGSWSDFAILFGLIVLLALYSIEFLNLKSKKKIYKIAQYFLLIVGIFFLAIINMPLVWLLVGIFATVMFVYSISIQYAGVNIHDGENPKKKFPFMALVIILVSFFFLVGNNSIGGFISRYINLQNTDIRPSVTTTAQIAYKAFRHNPLFGTGPGTFVNNWALWQPKEIARTIYWNNDFTNGFSLLGTFAVTTGLLGFVSLVLFIAIFLIRGIQSLRVALQNTLSNYFIFTTLMIAIYSWITIIIYNPNIIMLALAFASSGMLIGILVSRQTIKVKEITFLNDPRNSFFAILSLMVLMITSLSITYVYIEKFSSIFYFSKGLNAVNTMESLSKSENMLLRAINLDKNDIYYRTLSQVYVNEIGLLINDKTIPQDILKSDLQKLVNSAQGAGSEAVSQNPKQYLNYVNLGNVYSSLVPLSVANSYESAVGAYNKAKELSPNNPSIPLALAQLEFINKNNTKSREYIKQALAIKYDYTDAVFLLAQIETNEGNLGEAIKQAEYASKVAPNDPTVFFKLGILRYNNSDYSGAVSAFETAVILDNRYLNARYFLGKSYQKVGRKDDALVQFNILSKIDPNNQDIKDAISSISQPEAPKVETPTTPTTSSKTKTQKPAKLPLSGKQ